MRAEEEEEEKEKKKKKSSPYLSEALLTDPSRRRLCGHFTDFQADYEARKVSLRAERERRERMCARTGSVMLADEEEEEGLQERGEGREGGLKGDLMNQVFPPPSSLLPSH